MVEPFRYPPRPAGLPPDRELINSGDPHRRRGEHRRHQRRWPRTARQAAWILL